MIGKTLKGTHFIGLLAYLLSDEKVRQEGAHVIGGTVRTGTPKDLAKEYEGIRLLAPRRKHVVYHQMLSAPPEEGEALSDATWREIAADHARVMGYAGGQYTVVRHGNHVHIVANRVLLSGKVVSDSHDWPRAERSIRAIEKKYELTQIKASHLLEPEESKEHERAPSQAEVALAEKGESSVRELLQDQLLAIVGPQQTLTEFADKLYERGVLVRPNIQSTGRILGLSFVLRARPDLAFSGTRLGRRFTWGNLKNDGLCYDPVRDRGGVERCLQRCAEMEDPREPAQEKRKEPLQPLADPRAARQHLETLGIAVVLAARDRTGRVKELGTVNSQSIGRWKRRLRRRSALGEDILVRPATDASVLVVPGCTEPVVAGLTKLGIEPFVVVDTAWKRRDLWIRAKPGGSDVRKLRAGLREIDLYPGAAGDTTWGRLAGYRPDPISRDSSTAHLIKSRIALITDTAVDVSLELLERLRRLAAKQRLRDAPGATKKRERLPTGKGRSR